MAADEEHAAGPLKAAVIVIAHNEHGCALRRTLLAILGPRSSSALLAEVIVVDDSSSPPAEAAVADAGGVGSETGSMALAVRWLRSEIRLGVPRARTMAARAAASPVLCFLDAHCEPQAGWLPPLLALLFRAPRAVALPVIESIDPRTWACESSKLRVESPCRAPTPTHDPCAPPHTSHLPRHPLRSWQTGQARAPRILLVE